MNNYSIVKPVGPVSSCKSIINLIKYENGDEYILKKNGLNDIKTFQNESYALRKLNHPNIIKLHDSYMLNEFTYLVLEYIDGMDFFEYAINRDLYLEDVNLVDILKKIYNVVLYCHKNNFVHRDIKPENIMLKYDGDITLIDFGFSIEMNETKYLEVYSGSKDYASPEILKRIKYCPFKSDIYSLGVTLYVIATKSLPYIPKRKIERIIWEIPQKKMKFPSDMKNIIPEEMKEAILNMMEENPEDRKSLESFENIFK
jgi:serine/threonine protein kinase